MAEIRTTDGRLLLKQGVQSFIENSQNQIVDDARKQMIHQIEKEVEILLQKPIPELDMNNTFELFKTTGSRQEYEGLYFARRKRLTALGLMVIIHPNEKNYVEHLCSILEAICNEYTWCLPAHYDNEQSIDLFAAETAFTLAELDELIGERLPASLRHRMKQEVLQRVLEPFLAVELIWWEEAEHNWASVCAGSVGAAALYYLNDEHIRLERILMRAEKAMVAFLASFDEDGACKEGYVYWQYGFGYFIYFADLLRTYRNGHSALLTSNKVKQIALFQQKSFLAGKSVVNFSDSLPQVGVNMGLTHYLHGEFEEVVIPEADAAALLEEDHCGRWAPAVRNLLWTSEHPGAPWPYATYILEDAQWLVSRVKHSESCFSFAAKGGHNDEPHNHNDLGHFILAVNGHSLFADAGSGLYTRDYFGDKRYEYVCASSAGHSVPIINGMQQSPGAHYKALLLQCKTTENVDTMTLDLKQAYACEALTHFTRKFHWEKASGRLLLQDTFQSTNSNETLNIVDRFIVAHQPIVLDQEHLIIANEVASAVIHYDASQLNWTAEAFEFSDHFGKRKTLYALDFATKEPVSETTLAFSVTLQALPKHLLSHSDIISEK